MIMPNKSCSVSSRPKITATDFAILGMLYSSRALADPTSSQTRNTRHTSKCAFNLRKTDHTRNVYSSTIATSKTQHQPRTTLSTHSLGDELPAVAASGTISAQRKKLQVRKTEKQQLRILNPSPNTIYKITNATRTAARAPASAPPSAAVP